MKIERVALVLSCVALACALTTLVFSFASNTPISQIIPTDRTAQANELQLTLMDDMFKSNQDIHILDLTYNATMFNEYSKYFETPSNASVSEAHFIDMCLRWNYEGGYFVIRFNYVFYLTPMIGTVIATCTP